MPILAIAIAAPLAATALGAWLRWATVPVRFAFRIGRTAGLHDRREP